MGMALEMRLQPYFERTSVAAGAVIGIKERIREAESFTAPTAIQLAGQLVFYEAQLYEQEIQANTIALAHARVQATITGSTYRRELLSKMISRDTTRRDTCLDALSAAQTGKYSPLKGYLEELAAEQLKQAPMFRHKEDRESHKKYGEQLLAVIEQIGDVAIPYEPPQLKPWEDPQFTNLLRRENYTLGIPPEELIIK